MYRNNYRKYAKNRQGKVELALLRIKTNRAPGEDTILAELIKCGGEGIVQAIHELIKLLWTTEKIPHEWNTGIICPIYKKGDKLECNSYRGITLLNCTYKIFSIVIETNTSTCLSWTSCSPYRLWLKCNRLLSVGRP
jgi:hypothetical protein